MITQLKIENYKSIKELTLNTGRVNFLIGENGSGKSNILEAITFAAAAEANKLDNEFLSSRGIRVTEPELMRSAFDKNNCQKEIIISINFLLQLKRKKYILLNDNKSYHRWDGIIDGDDILFIENNENNRIIRFSQISMSYINSINDDEIKESYRNYRTIHDSIENFIIFSPENTSLRNLEKEGQIQPLGIYGEGLLKLLMVTQTEEPEALKDIEEVLELFGWYETVEIPNTVSVLERKITIKDRYLEMSFDQRSANEGFLLILFYITLVVSKYTPKIFAIDNIDTSLNPKLCSRLIMEITRLAKKYDKQIFLTSHNPAILDGIDLSDDEQRLIVVHRNAKGHTRCKRIELKDEPKSSIRDRMSRIFSEQKTYTKNEILEQFDNSDEPLKLSYALLRGYLGGLPKNF